MERSPVGRDEALRLLRSYLLLASSPPPEEKAVRRCSMDSPGGSPPRRGWETLDDDPLGEIACRSDVLTTRRGFVTADVLVKGLSRGAIATG